MAVSHSTHSELLPGLVLHHSDEHVHLAFRESRPALSSACYNGGFCHAASFLNIRVAASGGSTLEDPAVTLQRASQRFSCEGKTVGMMTAASMRSLRVAQGNVDGEFLVVLVTTGLENARRAGDPAEQRTLLAVPAQRGTINLAVATSARLTPEAMVELLMVATEARVAVLQDLAVASPISNSLATGTGTDSSAVFAGSRGAEVRFVGKHTLFGERLARLVMQAIRSSLQRDREVRR